MANTYDKLGASASKQGLHKALEKSGIPADHRYFAKLIASGETSHFLHCDGAGTKSIVAYLSYKESGDPGVFAGLAQDALVMNLDDIYCVGRPQQSLLANIINRNAELIDDEVLSVILESFVELQQQFEQLGVHFSLAGGETADMGDLIRTLVVDAVLSGYLRNDSLLSPTAIEPGNVIVGLSSTGQASYEKRPNSGIGSNGLTLARYALLSNDYHFQYPEIGPGREKSHGMKLSEAPDSLGGMTIGEALCSPTRSYSPILEQLYRHVGPEIKAAIHNTGGGQTKILRFARNLKIVKDNLFPVPPLFQLIQEQASIPWKEMYEVFNMGHRFELYTTKGAAPDIIQIAKEFAVEAQIIGRVEAAENSELQIETNTEELCYKLT